LGNLWGSEGKEEGEGFAGMKRTISGKQKRGGKMNIGNTERWRGRELDLYQSGDSTLSGGGLCGRVCKGPKLDLEARKKICLDSILRKGATKGKGCVMGIRGKKGVHSSFSRRGGYYQPSLLDGGEKGGGDPDGKVRVQFLLV